MQSIATPQQRSNAARAHGVATAAARSKFRRLRFSASAATIEDVAAHAVMRFCERFGSAGFAAPDWTLRLRRIAEDRARTVVRVACPRPRVPEPPAGYRRHRIGAITLLFSRAGRTVVSPGEIPAVVSEEDRAWYRGAVDLAASAYACLTGFGLAAAPLPLDSWATYETLDRVLASAQLGRGGGRGGRVSIASAVIAEVESARANAGLPPLSRRALDRVLGAANSRARSRS